MFIIVLYFQINFIVGFGQQLKKIIQVNVQLTKLSSTFLYGQEKYIQTHPYIAQILGQYLRYSNILCNSWTSICGFMQLIV